MPPLPPLPPSACACLRADGRGCLPCLHLLGCAPRPTPPCCPFPHALECPQDDDTLAEQARLGVVSAIHRLRVRRRAELRKLDEVKAARERSACGDGAAAAFADKEGAILLGIDRLDAASVHVEDTLAALQRWAADGEGRMATVLAGDDDDEPSG